MDEWSGWPTGSTSCWSVTCWPGTSSGAACHIDLGDDGDQEVARTLNLHVFHLLQTVSEHTIDLDVGVPARGLHGEAYRGHIFWDELFIFPFLNLRFPELTRALLQYRFRRLPEARESARAAGYSGAMYPWQSGSDGREETQRLHLNPKSGRWLPDKSHRQRHVNVAVAYNIWQYYQVTGDLAFLSAYGAELLLEIARFWASIASYDHDRDRYEIRGVMGPDEYHDGYPDRDEPGLDNNAYTNIMAAWVLCRALETLELLPDHRRTELAERLGLAREELDRWEEVSRKLRVCFHDGDIISQFEGYGDLQELDWESLRRRHGNIRRLDRILEVEGDSPNRYKASKQADVLMLFYLLSADELRGCWSGSATGCRRPPSPATSTTTWSGPRMGRPCPGWSTPGCSPAPTGNGPGGSSPRRWPPTSTTSRAAPPPRASTWAPWPARSTSPSAATPAWRPARTCSGSTRACPRSWTASTSTSATAATGGSTCTSRRSGCGSGWRPPTPRRSGSASTARSSSSRPGSMREFPL